MLNRAITAILAPPSWIVPNIVLRGGPAPAEPDISPAMIYRQLTRLYVYECRRNNHGAQGADNQTFADIEKYSVRQDPAGLAEELRGHAYRPQAVRLVYIPKADGK